MNEKDFLLVNQINTLKRKLECISLSLGSDDSVYRDCRYLESQLERTLNKTLKNLDFIKKCMESEEYKKTLYIDVIKRIYIFLKAYEFDRFKSLGFVGDPSVMFCDLEDIHKKLIKGMWPLSRIFDGKVADTLRKLLDYIEKANLPIQELPWEYQALVNFIIGTVHEDQHEVEYLIIELDFILITCGMRGRIPNIGEPVEEEKE